MISHVGRVDDEVLGQCILDREVPRFYVRLAEVLVNDIEVVAGMRCQLSRSNRQHAAVGKHDDAIGGDDSGHRRGEPLCHAGRFLASSVIESRD